MSQCFKMHFHPKISIKSSKYGFDREKVSIFRENDWARDSESVHGFLTKLVHGALKRPHLSLEDLHSLRNVNEYFNSQIDQYLKYRFMATYELEDPFLFLLTWIDTANEETVQIWFFLTSESSGVNTNSLSESYQGKLRRRKYQ